MGIRLGLFQESTDHFALAIHADTDPKRLFAEFDAANLHASIAQQEDESIHVVVDRLNAEVDEARNMLFQRMQSEEGGTVEAGVMALDTATDSWALTLLRNDMPSYHVALAFVSIPLQAIISPEALIYKSYELAGQSKKFVSWRILQPALLTQCAKIFYPYATTGADACALLANRHGILDYLMGLGETFSLADIEQLAALHQLTPSSVIAMASSGLSGENLSWIYQIQLSQRAVENRALLPVSYARAKSQHATGLRARPMRPGLTEDQLEYYEHQIDRFAHHLAVLELCEEYGIGLRSAPMGESDNLAVAVSPEREEADGTAK